MAAAPSASDTAGDRRLSVLGMDRRASLVANRRKSTVSGMSMAGSVMALQAASRFKGQFRRKSSTYDGSSVLGKRVEKPPMENTYRLEPEQGDTIAGYESKIKQIMEEALEQEFGNCQYSARMANRMCTSVSNVILSRVKELGIPRYKLVCNVLVGQQAGQGMYNASRCVWNTSTDYTVTVSFQNTTLFAVAMLNGVYFE